jgi:ribosome-binding factor A
MSIRTLKAEKLIKAQLSQYFVYEEQDPNLKLSITHVSISKDLKNAKVFVFIKNTYEETLDQCKILNKNNYHIIQYLIKMVQLRHVPKLKFVPDELQRKQDHIQSLLDQI